MPPLRDPDTIEKLRVAYDERTSGGVRWKRTPASEWLQKNLDSYSEPAIDDLVYEHIHNGGTIHIAKEQRDEYLHHKYHYDFHIFLPDFNKEVYVETTLMDARMGSIVTVVNIHWAD